MFLGSIPAPLRSVVRETVESWPRGDLYVPCCGNMTIERAVADLGFTIHSSDVSIYTSALGRWLTGQPVGIQLREDAEQLAWIAPYLDDGIGTVAVLMLATNFFGAVGKQDVLYWRRQYEAYRDDFPRLHSETVEKLRGTELRLASYEACDVREWLARVPAEAPVCSFPPFYSSGYETLYKPLDEHLTWDAPEYEVLTDDDVVGVLESITDRPYWLTASNHEVEDLRGNLRGIIKPSSYSTPFYVYASDAASRLVRPTQVLEPVAHRRLGRGDEIGDRMSLASLSPGQFNALRAQYLNPRIPPGSAMWPMAVLVDGAIVGCFGYGPPKYSPTEAYLLSDFAVAPSDYPRLSKLVVAALLSSEAQRLIQRGASRQITHMNTTAFSNNPVSMKYRGLLDLQKRAESTNPLFKFQLNYGSAIGRWTLAEALAEWKRKHGERRTA